MARAKLSVYHHKRDFRKTAEPQGVRRRTSAQGAPRFVVQKHDASHLHYDLRLESKGVLKSWAVPKGPSLNPADKHLAVETEDHPLAYQEFEGVIPEGNYGAGRVLVWDAGTYRNLRDPERPDVERDHREGKIEIWLQGKKLQGGFALIKMKGRGPNNWLLIKKKDAHANADGNILDERPESVRSGKTVEELNR